MEVRDGFIDGIFNYCDRWCETCAMTSWCRLFADSAQAEASLDPQLKALIEAPPLKHERHEVPEWMQEILEQVQDSLDKMTDEDLQKLDEKDGTSANEDDPLLQRASAYSITVHNWLGRGNHSQDPNDPRAVIAWFSTMIPAKIARALHGMGMEYPDPHEPTDHDGSAKVALLGIARSRAAWEQLAAHDPAASPSIAELTWLEHEVERMFPRARKFVRPAFDEPDEVARLLAERDSAG